MVSCRLPSLPAPQEGKTSFSHWRVCREERGTLTAPAVGPVPAAAPWDLLPGRASKLTAPQV